MTNAPGRFHQHAAMALAHVHASPLLPDSSDLAAPVHDLRDVYHQHADFVWRSLRALGVRDGDLDDQLHEVFLIVHRRLSEFEGRSRITTWLFAIAERVASDYRRSARIRRERVTAAVPDSPAPGASPESSAQQTEQRAVLARILDAMPPEQRVVFALIEIDAMKAEQVAELTGCPVNTVYSRLRLARKHFTAAVTRLNARGPR